TSVANALVVNTGTTATLTVASGSTTLSGGISGAGALTKTGSGTLTLTGTNTSSGTLAVSAGTLTAGAAGALSSSAAVSVSSGATLNLTASQTIASLSGLGAVTTNTSTLTVDASADSTFSGTITNGGNAWDASHGIFTKKGSGTLTLSNVTISGGETHLEGGAMAISAGASSVDYFAVGTGSGNTGTLAISGGTLSVGVALHVGDWGGTGTVNQTGGTVEVVPTCNVVGRCASFNLGNQGGTGVYKGLRSSETTVGVAIPLELGGKRPARVALATARLTRAQIQAEIARGDLRLRITLDDLPNRCDAIDLLHLRHYDIHGHNVWL
ncbi:MAG: hypothetical protein B7X76_09770, partial [Azorhizobium sp. 39-67-5]